MSGEPIVSTRLGKLRGSVQRSIVGDDYLSFKGIPYAKPPVGQLRFEDPLPAESWKDVRDATNYGPTCAQSDFFTKTINGGDDCLYLNVYTKNLNPDKKKPVMVWIHGGGFIWGDGGVNWYGPDYFMRKDIVLVTLNYRLGILGFLNLEDEVAPGNQGLKDQVLALKWVRENITNFGGDNENITIFGESAGAASVHYLCISPLAKGLFNKAICQSGVVLNSWACIASNPKKFAYKLCDLLGNNTRDHKEIIKFLRTIDPLKLIETQEKVLTPQEKVQLLFPFGPGIDTKSKNPFMPIHPEIAAKKGIQVPLLIGYVNREGIIFEKTYNENKNILPTKKSDFEKLMHPNIINIIKKYNLEIDDFRRLYFNNDDVTEENFENLIDLLGDIHFIEGIHRIIKIQVEKSSCPTYLYQFTFDNASSPIKKFSQTKIKGASHGDELAHLFAMKVFEPVTGHLKEGTVPYKIMEQMIELWVNFATTGRPTPTKTKLVPFYWQPVTDSSVLRCLNIQDDLRMDVTLNMEHRLLAHNFKDNFE